MSAAQKERFRQTLGDVGNVTTGLGSVLSTNRPSTAASPLFAAVPWLKASSSTEIGNSEREAVAQELGTAIQSGKCTQTGDLSGGLSSLASMSSLSVSVQGDSCPIQFGLKLSASGDTQNGSAQFQLNYRVSDDAFRSLAVIDVVSLNGSVELHSNTGSADGKVAFNGSLHSQKEGSLTLYINADGQMSSNGAAVQGNGELAFGIQFPDFTGELKVKIDGASLGSSGGGISYYLNDQQVDQSEFQTYLDVLDIRLSQWSQSSLPRVK
jgi:hypothetical protein